jgi:hypothetical protein
VTNPISTVNNNCYVRKIWPDYTGITLSLESGTFIKVGNLRLIVEIFFDKSTFPHAAITFFHAGITFFHAAITFFHAGITFFHAGITFLHARITFFHAGDTFLALKKNFERSRILICCTLMYR